MVLLVVVVLIVVDIVIVIATIEIPLKSQGAHLLRGPWDWCLARRGTDQELPVDVVGCFVDDWITLKT